MGESQQAAGGGTAAPETGGRTALRGTLVTAVATLGSRVLGLVRDVLMGAFVGITAEQGAFQLAWTVPNLFRRLFGEGAMSAAVLPALARAEEEGGRARAQAVFARFQAVFLIGLLGFVLLGEALVWTWHGLATNSDRLLALRFTGLLLPYLLPICLAALAGAPQHLTGRFSLPALAPAVLNAVWISTLLGVHYSLGFDDSVPALTALCGGILLGGLIQWWMQLPGLMREGFSFRPVFRAGDGTVRRALRSFAPALVGLAVMQINLLVDQVLVRELVGPEANSYTYFANRLLQFPLALIGISVATGFLPLFSRLAARGDHAELSRTLLRGSEMTLVVILAAAAGLYVIAGPTITVLFEHREFTAANTVVLEEVLRAYLWALPAAALTGLIVRVRQVRGDYRGPAWIAAGVVPVNLVLDLVLLPRIGVAGAGFATAAAIWLQAGLLLMGLRRLEVGAPLRLGRLPRLVVPALASTAGAWGLASVLGETAYTVPGLLLVIAAGLALAAASFALVLPAEFREFRALLGSRRRPAPPA